MMAIRWVDKSDYLYRWDRYFHVCEMNWPWWSKLSKADKAYFTKHLLDAKFDYKYKWRGHING
jgi:hypothetical protein